MPYVKHNTLSGSCQCLALYFFKFFLVRFYHKRFFHISLSRSWLKQRSESRYKSAGWATSIFVGKPQFSWGDFSCGAPSARGPSLCKLYRYLYTYSDLYHYIHAVRRTLMDTSRTRTHVYRLYIYIQQVFIYIYTVWWTKSLRSRNIK